MSLPPAAPRELEGSAAEATDAVPARLTVSSRASAGLNLFELMKSSCREIRICDSSFRCRVACPVPACGQSATAIDDECKTFDYLVDANVISTKVSDARMTLRFDWPGWKASLYWLRHQCRASRRGNFSSAFCKSVRGAPICYAEPFVTEFNDDPPHSRRGPSAPPPFGTSTVSTAVTTCTRSRRPSRPKPSSLSE